MTVVTAPRPHQITDEDVKIFTNGACHVLAREVSLLTGWPINCFLDSAEDPDKHAFVVPAPGWRLDVMGTHPAYEHDKSWGWQPYTHSAFTYDEIVTCWRSCGGTWVARQEAHTARSRQIAPLLIAAFAEDQRVSSQDRGLAPVLASVTHMA